MPFTPDLPIPNEVPILRATVPCLAPPNWAVWERRLIDTMGAAVYPFLAKYTYPDGTLIWREYPPGEYPSRDGADDFYEGFYNWPLLYLLGGGDHLLGLAHRQWEAVTRQLTALGLVHKEYERGYDQFHQGESYIYFYFLCLADPTNPTLQDRARRFAGFYLNEDPDIPHEARAYDAHEHLIRAPHTGSTGARWGYFDDGSEIAYHWAADMAPYGLPFEDVPGLTTYDDLRDPALARRMGQAMQARMGRGDVATNLIATSLLTNAYLITGEGKYRDWVVNYTRAWQRRAESAGAGGLLPDNIGLSGMVGEYLGGRWYGGLYGWSWPHGYYNIGMAAVVAGANVALLTGDSAALDLPRSQIDAIHRLGQTFTIGEMAARYGGFWHAMVAEHGPERSLFLVPYRHADSGWFDYQTPTAAYPVAVWAMTHDPADWARVEVARNARLSAWDHVAAERTKEDGGHDLAWIAFLKDHNPDYPVEMLRQSYGQVVRRMDRIRADDRDLTTVNIHHWQELNPVTTEALVQLTLGGPQFIYNGGLLHCQVRYFDAASGRPGLPPDVAALVETVEADHLTLTLVNLSVLDAHSLIIQAGAFGEHRFTTARYAERTSDYPMGHRYAAPPLHTAERETPIHRHWVQVEMPPGTILHLRLGMERYCRPPTYQPTWIGAR